jgi:hypothetical protein
MRNLVKRALSRSATTYVIAISGAKRRFLGLGKYAFTVREITQLIVSAIYIKNARFQLVF